MIHLATINRILRRVGLILVVEIWDGSGEPTPTRIGLWTWRRYCRNG